MSLKRTYNITCDGCGRRALGFAYDTSRATRKAAERYNWKHLPNPTASGKAT